MDKKNIFRIFIMPILSLVLLLVVWKSAEYLKMSYFILPNLMSSYLPFKTNPIKDGGDTLIILDDDIGDAGMNGKYVLPENPKFQDAYSCVDIVSCTIRKPYDINGSRIWNIDIRMLKTIDDKNSPSGFSLLKGTVYVDTTFNDTAGNNGSKSAGEKIAFPEDFSWDYLVEFDCLHNTGNLISQKTGNIYPVKITYFEKSSTMRLGIPFAEDIDKRLNRENLGKIIIATGFYSPLELGGLVPLKENPDRTSSGGGVGYEFLSPYYDFITSGMKMNENKLSIILPVDIKKYEFIDYDAEIRKKIEMLTVMSKEKSTTDYKASDNDILKTAIAFYDARKNKEAEAEFSKYLSVSSAANTYLAVITAMKSGTTNDSSKKIEYVSSCYEYFERANERVKDDGDLYIYLTNIIGVSMSVPDDIFGKLDTAGSAVKKLLMLNLPKAKKAEYYLKLIDIYKKKNNMTELKILNKELDRFLK